MGVKLYFLLGLRFSKLIAKFSLFLITDAHEVDITQKFGSVDEICFNKFRYRNMAEIGYDVLLTSPLSYLSRFTGLGQVKPKPDDVL